MALRNQFDDPFNDPFFQDNMSARVNHFNPFAQDPFFNHSRSAIAMSNPMMMMPNNPFMAMENMMNNMMAPFHNSLLGMHSPMNDFRNLERNANCHTFSSSSIMTYSSNGGDGQPQIYQASSSTHSLPNGIKKIRRTVKDSASGLHKMAIGHHIGDRSHTIEDARNMKTGSHEHVQNLVNLTEEDAETFDREWQQATKAEAHAPAIRNHRHQRKGIHRGLPGTEKVRPNRLHKKAPLNASKEYVPPTPPRGGGREQDNFHSHSSRHVRFDNNNTHSRRY
ncbi:uncharacterized protein TRIADDRAFT_64011 [Trichoplax adhaerens]|uniref:Myeloid leukemia factor n=1 Tax=Trichoplax adhaerens TaxID=10228 RepID=B3RZG7_TRIAD|nr:hypothetical protein TRIADDRAFT_64011 [Trichoplax adhaerens]EDV23838.1 hypothetical protein TRIADDRAFT_64011 [Trichoplax adhaerens]|eukprot:XP_002113364.1 hypothetical protein TRIADDRAFT_64011 [Trichoplax adhaerens]